MPAGQKFRIVASVLTGSLLCSIAFGLYHWSNASYLEKKVDPLRLENENLLTENQLLESHLSSLQRRNDTLTQHNRQFSIETEIAEQRAALSHLELDKVKKLLARYPGMIGTMRMQLKDLQNLKIKLEDQLSSLQLENRNQTVELISLIEKSNGMEKETVRLLNIVNQQELKIVEQSEALKYAGIRVANFRVELKNRRNKLTQRGAEVKKVNVSFDLTGIPVGLEFIQPVSLLLVSSIAPPMASLTGLNDCGETGIIARVEEKIQFKNAQRIALTCSIDAKLPPGKYQAGVFMEHGLLGTVEFSVN